MRGRLTVCRLAGIPIDIQASWIPVFVFVSWTLAARFFPLLFPGWPTISYWTVGIIGGLLLFFSLLAHELSHAVVARWRGMNVVRITFFFLGGVAEIDLDESDPGDEFWMALAGPAVSLLLAACFSSVWLLLGQYLPFVGAIAIYLAMSNVLLAGFNLLPGYPLDGGRVLRATLWQLTGNRDQATRWAGGLGQAFGTVGIIIGLFAILSGDMLTGLWFLIAGGFLVVTARGALAPYLPETP